jgi:hypothetical protein
LWQFLCGGIDLPLRDYQHVVTCTACETFGEQILDALGFLETALHDRQVISTRGRHPLHCAFGSVANKKRHE